MKTKLLLCAMLFISFLGFSQISIFEGFESGTIPATWTNVGTTVVNNSSGANTGSYYTVMSTNIGTNTSLTTSNLVYDGSAVDIFLKYRKIAGTGVQMGMQYFVGASTTPVLLFNLNLGPSSASATYLPLTANIPAGALPNGTNIRIQFFVWGQNGSSSAVLFDDFAAYSHSTYTAPTVITNSVTPSATSAFINYSLNANNAATTSVVKYGLSASSLTNQVTGFSASGTALTTSLVNLTGLSTGVQYFYKIEATNIVGTTSSTVGNFTPSGASLQLVSEYNFNNTLTNINGTEPFNTNISNSFVADRNGVANKALRIVFSGVSTSITGLPTGSGQRSVSMWYKVAATNSVNNNCLFVYGASGGENAYGVSFNTTNTWYNFAWNTNTPFNNATNDGNWHHIVTTFDQSKVSKVYVDGALVATQTQNGWNTTPNNNTFWLGSSFAGGDAFSGTVDDLKIYNYALAQNEINDLFSGVPSTDTYTFNNTLANILGTEPFSSANTSYAMDRNSVSNNALSITAGAVGTSATITNLPVGNAARTIAFWYKVDSNVDNSTIFTYGTTGASQFGMYIQSTGRPVFWSNIANPVFGTGSFAAGTWHHAVLTYDGTNVRIYMNGVLQDTKAFAASTTASALRFYNASTTLGVDDLNIYNRAISQTEVTNLYINNTLSSQTFNQNNLKVSLYPNPAKDMLNIEMTNEVKSIEIYNIQGQKVKVANQKQINVSDLAAGMYMIRIEDADNAIATKKFVKQ